jgi:hypothetical protein
MGLYQIKNLLHSRETINKVKAHPTEWETILPTVTTKEQIIQKKKMGKCSQALVVHSYNPSYSGG